MASFAARFIAAFGQSNLGALLAIKGADALRDAGLPLQVTLIGIVLLTASIDLLVGSASAKWALIAPVFVPMLVQLGVSPDLAQAAYRVGDSSTNMITPLLPYSVTRLVAWSAWLIVFWSLGLPLGVQASYEYPASR
jgi:aminobenzoyl-glutamate transport protein